MKDKSTSFIPKFVAADLDAALGVFFDGFTKVLVGVAVLSSIMPGELYGTLLPGLGFTLFIWCAWLFVQAQLVAKRTGKPATALPGGLNAGRFFIWLFGIMLPAFERTGDITQAWKAGIGANIIGAVVFLVFAPFLDKLMKIIPKPAVFGALAGGAAAWLLLSPLADGFARPELILISLFALLLIHFGKIKSKFSASAIAIGAGTIAGWLLKYMSVNMVTESFSNISFYIPKPSFGLISGSIQAALPYLPMIIAFAFTDVVSAIQSVEQGKVSGDEYSMKESVFAGGIINLIGSLVGNPFPIGYYWGHPAWKRIGAGASYPIITGGIYLVLTLTGLVAVATSIIPVEATFPLLIFAALITMAQAFEINDKKYYAPMALGFALPIYELILGKMTDAPLGYLYLGKGSMFLAIIYSYIVCAIIDREWKKISYAFIVLAGLSSLGLIHLANIAFPPTINNFVLVYIGLAAFFFALSYVIKDSMLEAEDEAENEAA